MNPIDFELLTGNPTFLFIGAAGVYCSLIYLKIRPSTRPQPFDPNPKGPLMTDNPNDPVPLRRFMQGLACGTYQTALRAVCMRMIRTRWMKAVRLFQVFGRVPEDAKAGAAVPSWAQAIGLNPRITRRPNGG
jgi:hypothetical protein